MKTYYEGINGRLIPVKLVEEKGRHVVVSVERTGLAYVAGELLTIPKLFFVEKVKSTGYFIKVKQVLP